MTETRHKKDDDLQGTEVAESDEMIVAETLPQPRK